MKSTIWGWISIVILSLSLVGSPVLAKGKGTGGKKTPPGWEKSEKKGWNSDMPPGLEKKNKAKQEAEDRDKNRKRKKEKEGKQSREAEKKSEAMEEKKGVEEKKQPDESDKDEEAAKKMEEIQDQIKRKIEEQVGKQLEHMKKNR